MTAQRSNCNLFVLFGVSVVHYILRVVPQDDAIPPWLSSGKSLGFIIRHLAAVSF